MSGGFKWLEIPGDMYMVIADDDGKIIAYVMQPPKNPASAYIGDRFLGRYVTNEAARLAVEAEMSEVRRHAVSNSGKAMPAPLPMDERAWLEEPH